MIEPSQKSATLSSITPSVWRRLASMVYELLVLGAVVFIAAMIFSLMRNPQAPGAKHFFQAYLFLVILAYFAWFCIHGGQTVAMRAWHFFRIRSLACTWVARRRWGLAVCATR